MTAPTDNSTIIFRAVHRNFYCVIHKYRPISANRSRVYSTSMSWFYHWDRCVGRTSRVGLRSNPRSSTQDLHYQISPLKRDIIHAFRPCPTLNEPGRVTCTEDNPRNRWHFIKGIEPFTLEQHSTQIPTFQWILPEPYDINIGPAALMQVMLATTLLPEIFSSESTVIAYCIFRLGNSIPYRYFSFLDLCSLTYYFTYIWGLIFCRCAGYFKWK